ncbi:MAG: UvrB/UvrC motif-containing protein [Terrisporobacter othiniensis]|uniref:UvrB/UvrC motif-containing protein n=1 Tax=Terrisporobacter petrolearius TaxID=1460447 RepID=UPI0022E83C04|nr:UvrB/UvrC motif-containing protein [Terrisporobacter petrolearius]MDU4862841.1 UvrB/UvrC motif-containing protein [Terrisporobacter othiniensis]MDU6996677.1 UvrB/UvrC motif-containing protein [Terrisporobacter othiniensis]
MLCQKCHKKTASVFISSIINGQESRMYLCNDCAKNYPLFNFNSQDPFSIKDVMEKFDISEDDSIETKKENLLAMDKDCEESEIVCPNCYSTYNEYRETGKVGCSKCYEVFEKQLKPILRNIYGYEEYIGKSPKKDNSHIYPSKEMITLKEDLNRAVEQEEYEKAAYIRDKIKELEECNE